VVSVAPGHDLAAQEFHIMVSLDCRHSALPAGSPSVSRVCTITLRDGSSFKHEAVLYLTTGSTTMATVSTPPGWSCVSAGKSCIDVPEVDDDYVYGHDKFNSTGAALESFGFKFPNFSLGLGGLFSGWMNYLFLGLLVLVLGFTGQLANPFVFVLVGLMAVIVLLPKALAFDGIEHSQSFQWAAMRFCPGSPGDSSSRLC
jgi:hypothetical protein